jgi:hypothetical protein
MKIKIMDEIFGSIVLEYIGASTKWVIYFFISKLKGQKVTPFKQILDGKKGSKQYDAILHGWSNIWVGVIVIISIAVLLVMIDFD